MKARLPQGMGGGPQNMQSMLRQAQKMQENIEAKKPNWKRKNMWSLPAAAWWK